MKTIKLGYEGEEALLLCRELKRNGYSVKESRTFTQEMKEAVIDFQQKNKLDADGIVGYRTWEVLFFTGHPITERLTEEDFYSCGPVARCGSDCFKSGTASRNRRERRIFCSR